MRIRTGDMEKINVKVMERRKWKCRGSKMVPNGLVEQKIAEIMKSVVKRLSRYVWVFFGNGKCQRSEKYV